MIGLVASVPPVTTSSVTSHASRGAADAREVPPARFSHVSPSSIFPLVLRQTLPANSLHGTRQTAHQSKGNVEEWLSRLANKSQTARCAKVSKVKEGIWTVSVHSGSKSFLRCVVSISVHTRFLTPIWCRGIVRARPTVQQNSSEQRQKYAACDLLYVHARQLARY